MRYLILSIFLAISLFSCKKDKEEPEDANVTFSETMTGLIETRTYDQSGNYTKDTTENCTLEAKIYGADSAFKVVMLDPNGNALRSGTALVDLDIETNGDKILTSHEQDCFRIQLNRYSGKWNSRFTPTCAPGGQELTFWQY